MNDSVSAGSTSRPRLAVGVVLMVAGLASVVLALLNRSWVAAAFAAAVVAALVFGVRRPPMELALDVGNGERHHVVFRFDKFWGTLSITVDGRPVVRDLRVFSIKLTKTYRFSVGTVELHEVRIEKDRPLIGAGARSQPVRAYVDDVLAATGVA